MVSARLVAAPWWQRVTVAFAVLSMLGVAGCDGEQSGDGGEGDPDGLGADGTSGGDGTSGTGEPTCLTDRDFFLQKLWPSTLAKVCMACHQPGGSANEAGARFEILPASYPGFADANIANLSEMAKIQYNSTSQLLLKPLAQVAHGGGGVIEEGSDQAIALAEFVARVEAGDNGQCQQQPSQEAFTDVVLLTPQRTLRKAALHLVGRLPTATELERVGRGAEGELQTVLLEMMQEEAFHTRLKELWNDTLLTDRYLAYTGSATNLLDESNFPGRTWYDAQDDATRRLINTAVAREPLELISHIVRNDRPFDEVITARYTVFNPYSAQFYGLTNLTFDDPTNENEWREGQISIVIDGAPVTFPHAGVLSSPMVLNRFPTTPTNRNRARSRFVLKTFLATDILKAAERPVDPLAATNYLNPTRDDPTCSVCHRMIDPVAGGFQKFDDNNAERYQPAKQWFTDMYAPGFGKEIMPTGEFNDALSWVAHKIIDDPRFSLSMVHLMHEALTGHPPLDYPSDLQDPDFDARRRAWESQDAYFGEIIGSFEANNRNLKYIIAGVIAGPYYRADSLADGLSPARTAELASLGTSRLSSPELLSRKIQAVMGIAWARSWDRAPYLESDYRELYGGINSDTVTARLAAPNGVMANIMLRMANEVSCAAIPREFLFAAADRKLLPFVERTDMPETANGDEIPASIERIRNNIQHLYRQLLDEDLPLDHPEIERAFQIYKAVWREGFDGVKADTIDDWMLGACRAERDPVTNADLPDAERVRTDPDYTMRAWMAVTTYMLTDWRFIYE
jgi:hypothetical protein